MWEAPGCVIEGGGRSPSVGERVGNAGVKSLSKVFAIWFAFAVHN
jgi:hypothetical protein